METKPLRSFLEIPYDELEEMNLGMKRDRLERVGKSDASTSRTKSESKRLPSASRTLRAASTCSITTRSSSFDPRTI